MYQLFLSGFNEALNTLDRLSGKKLKYQISSKSVQWKPSCSMQTDSGQTDITKVIVAFRNFVNAPKNQSVNTVQ